MNIKSATSAISRKVGRSVLTVKKNSPGLLLVGGIVGMTTTVVLASKATLKVEPILDELDKNLAKVDQVHEAGLSTETQKHQTRVAAYTKATVKLGKLYGPALLVGIASVAALTSAHNIQNNRIAGLTAVAAGLKKSFDTYRQRVVDEYGEEKDREFYFGAEEREVVVETEHGPEVTKVKTAAGEGGLYTPFFSSETSKNWSPNPEYNVFFLKAAQAHANERLNTQGYVLLNDVLESLGMPRTSAGCVTGWLRDGWVDKNGKKHMGDGYVDLGCWDESGGSIRDFMWRGRAAAVQLNFNVDGTIYDKI